MMTSKSIKSRLLVPVLLVSISLLSCRKDFLDRNPSDAISGQVLWKNEADVKLALTGAYFTLQQDNSFNFRKPYLDCYSDNAYYQHTSIFRTLQMGIVTPTSGLDYFYNSSYRGIAVCNYFLENVVNVEMGELQRSKYIAEARFLRALYYFQLTNFFGGVVIYETVPESVDAAKMRQSSQAEVLDIVIKDLDFAIDNLPNTAYQGRAVKGSAMALKARVLLFMEKWEEAALLAREIIDGGVFSLSPDYRGIFISAGQGGNPEIIFATEYLGPNNPHWSIEGGNTVLGWYQSVNPLQNLVDEYECIDGKMIDESPLFDPSQPFQNRDPRLQYTISLPDEVWINPDGSVFNPLGSSSGYSMKKYLDLSLLPFNYDREMFSDWNPVHLRYADVLLMYAESRNEATGPDATVYDALDQIRARADVGMPPVDRAVYNSQGSLREFIRHERRIELAMEGYRYFDLKRWRIASDVLEGLKNPGNESLVFGEKNYVMPFPQSEIDRNPNLDQNEGY